MPAPILVYSVLPVSVSPVPKARMRVGGNFKESRRRLGCLGNLLGEDSCLPVMLDAVVAAPDIVREANALDLFSLLRHVTV